MAPDSPAAPPGEPGRPRVGFVGVGVMAEAVLTAVLAAGTDPADVVVTARRAERARELTDRHGVAVVGAAQAAAADVVVLGVKPPQLDGLLGEIAASVRPGALVVSLLAGVTTRRLEAALPTGAAVVRSMPNTPALVGAGVTAISGGASATDEHVARAAALLAGTGLVERVPEHLMDAVTGLSGSGPAYLFAVVDALAEGGVNAGLPRALALRLATGTALGAARLLSETGTHPALLREQVTSPAGTTAAGLRELDAAGVRAALVAAVLASARRSAELAGPAGPGGRAPQDPPR